MVGSHSITCWKVCGGEGIVSYILISDINIMLHDANSNALEGGGGGYHQSVRMVLDRGGGQRTPPKRVIYYLNAPLRNGSLSPSIDIIEWTIGLHSLVCVKY